MRYIKKSINSLHVYFLTFSELRNCENAAWGGPVALRGWPKIRKISASGPRAVAEGTVSAQSLRHTVASHICWSRGNPGGR